MLKNRKSIAVILSLVMLLVMACGAWALTPVNGVYEIGTAADLAEFRDMVNAGSNDIDGKLTANITLPNEAWMPIGTWVFEGGVSHDYTYQGTFDGNGKKIDGLTIRPTALAKMQGGVSNAGGLFGEVGPGGYIRNLLLTNVDVNLEADTEMAGVGALVGNLLGGIVENCGVSGGSIKGALALPGSSGACGGLAGYAPTYFGAETVIAEISNSFVKDLTSIENKGQTGGLVGSLINGSTLSNCYVSNIETIKATAGFVGGLVGWVRNNPDGGNVSPGDGVVSNCYVENIGEIINTGAFYVGAIAGSLRATDPILIKNCVYVGFSTTLSADSEPEGGITGHMAGSTVPSNLDKIENCLYPKGLTFKNISEDRPIGNITPASLDATGRTDLLPYNAASDDEELPAIVAALAEYTVTILVGESYPLDASTFPGTGGAFECEWIEGDPAIAGIAADGMRVTLTGVAVGSTTVTAKIAGDINVELTCMVNVTDEVTPKVTGTPEDGFIYEGEAVNLTYSFDPYTAIPDIDNAGMDLSGLLAAIVDGKVVVTGTAGPAGTYYYVVTLQGANGEIITQRVYVTIQGGSRPFSNGHGSGSSNCSAGFGATALLSLLGLALVMRKK